MIATFSVAFVGDAWGASNEEVLALTKAKVGDEAILAQIANHPCDYRLEISDITSLRKAGVSGTVIAAMIRRCAAARPTPTVVGVAGEAISLRPGIYAVETEEGRTRYGYIVPAVVAAGQAGGSGSVLLPFKSKVTLPGSSGTKLAISNRPSFWIVSAAPTTPLTGASSLGGLPADYSDIRLARLEQKKDRRQLQVGAGLNRTAIAEIDPKRIVPLRFKVRSATIHVIEPVRDLDPGQYALVVRDGETAFRMYDFAIP